MAIVPFEEFTDAPKYGGPRARMRASIGGGDSDGGAGAAGGGYPVERAQSFDAKIAQDPTQGALERMLRSRLAADAAGRTAAGSAVASGSYGSSRAAGIGGAGLMANAAMQGQLASDQIADIDLNRQQSAYLQDASLATGTSQFNASQGNNMTQFGAQHGLDSARFGLEERALESQLGQDQIRNAMYRYILDNMYRRGMVPWRSPF